MTLAFAGCRLSEALALTVDRVDLAAGPLIFETLKKRRMGFLGPCQCRRRCLNPSILSMVSANIGHRGGRGAANCSGPGAG